MTYTGVTLQSSISIKKIYSIHYFEYMSDFSFPGESHDFWEFVSVDKGEVEVVAGTESFVLKKGDITFHHPNQFHTVNATGNIAPNLIVISFECNDDAMSFFKNKILKTDEVERNLLADIIIEARRCFDCRLDDPYLEKMPLKESEIFASEQMIQLSLEHFLIHMIRRYSNPVVLNKHTTPAKFTKASKCKSDIDIYNRVLDYLESNINTRLTIEQICRDNLIGRSQLQKIFQAQSGLGIIEHFSLMKINAAKQMIRTDRMNFTQISEHLGYNSIHYFSRQFKKITGMTPSEYSSSIKAISERNDEFF